MVPFIPITLSGNTLGERHRQLNSLVNDAYKYSIPFKSIQDVPESSPIDRIFKIDLASKHRDVDYIVQNLKDTDMLYVSRALKCTWLLDSDYSHIINPDFLEDALFPEMITPAINKMKHWIHYHLQDPERCRIFYDYYTKSDFQLAINFLRNCCNEYLLEEFQNIMTRIKPKQLKVLSEKCPQLAKTFYGRIKHDKDLLIHYLDHEEEFLHNLKYLLKPDPDTFFDILEKYYNVQRNRSLRSDLTQYIMLHHRDKFSKKPELYTVHLLDMNALAKCLSPEEAKDVVVKLAHAAYLEDWFTYKTIEPLILRLDKDARVALMKMIFVNKELGVKIKNWPYDLPTSPVREKKPGYSLFLDKVHDPRDYDIQFKKLRQDIKYRRRFFKKQRTS
ncbi:uncharacterized protein [Choristoneura fumiferana]|uniref:uncharacterized protein n=1 Tax=Choristoneura fumiferana TaxID=7141 RepID=UPI003D158C66